MFIFLGLLVQKVQKNSNKKSAVFRVGLLIIFYIFVLFVKSSSIQSFCITKIFLLTFQLKSLDVY